MSYKFLSTILGIDANFTGKLGVGTTTPNANIEVVATVGSTTMLVGRANGNSSIKALNDAGGGFLALDSANVGNATIINHYTTDNIWLATGGGNVGIGSTTPGYKLEINSNGTSPWIQRFTNGSSAEGYLYCDNAGSGIFNSTSFNAGIYSTTGGLGLYAGYSKKASLLSNGNFLLGTVTDTGYKLQVSGIVTFRDDDLYYQGFLEATSNNVYLGSLGNQNINLYSGGVSYLFINGSNGNVGIGTTSPYGKLEVRQSSLYDGLYVTESAASKKSIGIWHNGTDGHIESTYLATGSYTGLSLDTSGASRIYIASNGNVGIGTTTPITRLQIDKASQSYTSSIPSGATVISNLTSGNAALEFGVDNTYLGYIQSRNITNTTYYNLLLNPSGGYVGIGTTSPSGNLEINSPATTTFVIKDPNSIIRILNFGGSNYIQSATAASSGSTADLYFTGMYGSPTHMLLKSNGNLLIGTTTDVGIKLYVSGGIRANGGNGQVDVDPTSGAFRFYDGTTFRGGFGTDAWATSGSPDDLTTYLNNGNYYIYSAYAGAKIFTAYKNGIINIQNLSGSGTRMVVADGSGTLSTQSIPTGTVTGSGTTNYISKWTSSSALGNSLLYDDGTNIGIGTTSPAQKLSIIGGIGVYYNDIKTFTNAYGSNGLIRLYGTDSLEKFQQGLTSGGDAYLYTFTGNNLLFYTNNGSERMRITSGGNVGIGTSGPSYLLDVNGASGFRNDMYAYTSTYWYNGSTYFQITNSSNRGLIKMTDNASPVVLQPSGGNVGIGTTTPSQKLTVQGVLNSDDYAGSYYGAWLLGNTNNGSESYLGLGPWYSQAGYVKWIDNSRLSIYTYNTGRFVSLQEAGGNVVIGSTTDNGNKLQVVGGQISLNTSGQTTNISNNYYSGTTGYNIFIGGGGNLLSGSGSQASYNTSLGYDSLRYNTTGSCNIGIGVFSLLNNTTGSSNVGIGFQSLYYNTTGSYNVGIGHNALVINSTGNQNTAIGYYSSAYNSTGSDNTSIGFQSLRDNTTGVRNTAVGSNSLLSNTTGNYNTSVGKDSLFSNTIGEQNTALGFSSLFSNTTASYNTAIGFQSLSSNTTGEQNTAVGRNSMVGNITGSYNTALGLNSLGNNTIGNYNTAVGLSSLLSNTTGSYNTSLGQSALRFNTTGSDNVGIGSGSLQNNTTGSNNVGLGSISLYSNTTGINNVGIGFASLYANSTGNNNTAIGFYSMNSNVVGNYNTALGYSSLQVNTSERNTAIGYASLAGITSGYFNTALGMYSGLYDNSVSTISTNINSVFLGYQTKASANGNSNEIVIGFDAEGQGSNSAVLGNSSITKTVLRGNVLIGTTTDNGYKLQVNGTQGISLNGVITQGPTQYYSINIPGPTANFGNGVVYLRLASSSTVLITTLRVTISTTWNWAPGFGYITADYSFYNSGGTLNLANRTVLTANGLAAGNLNLGELVFEGGYLSIPIYSSNSNNIFVKIENVGGLDVSTISYSSWSNTTFPGSNSVYVQTRLGINTTTPGYSLEVQGDIYANGTNGAFTTANALSNLYMLNLNRTPVSLTTAGSVLVGTTTDAGYKLDVNGTGRFTSEVYAQTFNVPSNAGGSGSFNFGYASNLSSRSWRIANDLIAYGDFGIGQSTTQTGGTYDYSKFYINPNGNVGIGTTSPYGKLEVRQSSLYDGLYVTESAASQKSIGIWHNGTDGHIESTYLATGSYTGLSLDTSGTSRIYIAANGNVGIGTASPSQKLQIGDGTGTGNQYVRVYSSSSDIYIGQSGSGLFGLSANSAANIVQDNANPLAIGTTFSQPLIFGTTNAERMRITSNGFVGIGVNNPLNQLVLPNNQYLAWKNSVGIESVGISTDSSNSLIFFNVSERMRIASSGNVLIGTTTDAGYKLDVNGTGRFSDSLSIINTSAYQYFQRSNSTDSTGILLKTSSFYDWYIGQNPLGGSTSDFSIYSYGTGTQVFNISKSSGNVLIGTTTDAGYKLQVAGSGYVSSTLQVGSGSYNGYTLQVEGSATFGDTVIQNQPLNANALGGITSYQPQSGLSYNFGNGTYSGETISGVVATDVYAGQIVVLRQSGQLWQQADASVNGPLGYNMLGIVCYDATIGNSTTILLNGFFASNSYYSSSPQYGSPMYLSPTTPGNAQDTAPSTTGNIVRIIGHINDYSNYNGVFVLRFNPDNFWLVI